MVRLRRVPDVSRQAVARVYAQLVLVGDVPSSEELNGGDPQNRAGKCGTRLACGQRVVSVRSRCVAE